MHPPQLGMQAENHTLHPLHAITLKTTWFLDNGEYNDSFIQDKYSRP